MLPFPGSSSASTTASASATLMTQRPATDSPPMARRAGAFYPVDGEVADGEDGMHNATTRCANEITSGGLPQLPQFIINQRRARSEATCSRSASSFSHQLADGSTAPPVGAVPPLSAHPALGSLSEGDGELEIIVGRTPTANVAIPGSAAAAVSSARPAAYACAIAAASAPAAGLPSAFAHSSSFGPSSSLGLSNMSSNLCLSRNRSL